MNKRIDCMIDLQRKCTGCMACVDTCPKNCISVTTLNGFNYPSIDTMGCISCGKCFHVCPLVTKQKNTEEQRLYAVYAKNKEIKNSGSSGGVFELLADFLLKNGYHVCGAGFKGTELSHRIINSREELKPLLKSKYIQSNTKNTYKQIFDLLKKGEKVFFCGTPCQVSALKNFLPNSEHKKIFTADIVCHGVPSQKSFDDYIETLEKKHKGKVSEFSFRVKNNRYKHAHGYSYRVTKKDKSFWVNGIYTNSTFYNAFKKYLFLREGCYECEYATLKRVSDITLADFWGIEKYDFDGSTDAGVSMIIINTQKGENVFNKIVQETIYKEFPLQYGIDSNHCLTHSTEKPKQRDKIMAELEENGYEQTANKYFRSSIKDKIYWMIPSALREVIRRARRGKNV